MNTEPEHPNSNDPGENTAQPNPDSRDSDGAFAENEEILQLETVDSTADLEAKLAAAEKQVLLAHADLENFRKRTRRESEDRVRYASSRLMGEILEAVDNLNRAIESANTNDSEKGTSGLLEGVTMVAQQISNVLENHGCKKIEAVGQPFDPNLHQAVQMQASEEFSPNTVMLEMRPGFMLYDRVIRPSQVFVSTGNPSQE